MIRLTEKSPACFELYEALAYFLSRQQLVVRAVIDQGVSPESLKQGVMGWHDKTPQTGPWGDSWRFMFHGGGCELHHQQTGEPIDWNGPDPLSFGVSAFIYHLQWRLAQGHTLPHLQTLMEQEGEAAIRVLIRELITDGIISPERHLLPDLIRTSAA